MAAYDAVFVGSGINALVGAALLSREGWSVCVLEREDRLGGAIRTVDGYTLPGFTHEVMSSWHPLFTGSAAHAELGDELRRRGLEYVNTDLPTATAFPDGEAMFLQTSLEANVAEFDRHHVGDGAAWAAQFEAFMANADLSFGVLGTELWSGAGLSLGRSMLRRLGRRGLLDYAGSALSSCRDWTAATFASERAHGLLAPWVLHTGLGPDNAMSGFMTQVIACAVQLGGMPVPIGRRRAARRRAHGDRHRRRRRDAHRRARRPDRRLGRTCGRRRPRRRRDRAGHAGRDRGRDADAALRLAPAGRLRAGRGARRGCALSLRPRGNADPPRPRRAAALGRCRGRPPRAHRDRPRHARPRRGLAGGQRGRAWPPARRGDHRRRPALRCRPDPRTRRQVDRLDPAPGAAGRSRARRRGG